MRRLVGVRSITRLAWRLLVLVPCGATAQATRPELPLELTYGRHTIARYNHPSLSADGRWLAYVVKTPPASTHGFRWIFDGVPGDVAGYSVHVASVVARSDAESQGATRISPTDVDCWRPVFSPDSRRVAFYCDDGGTPHLWVYDVVTRASQRVSDVKIKAKLWRGDEPVWSPDGTEIFVPLAPDVPPQADAPFMMKENNATLAAVEVTSGADDRRSAVRVVVPATATPAPSVLRVSPSGRWLVYLSVNGRDCAIAHAALDSTRSDVRVVAVGVLRQPGDDFWLTACRWHPREDWLFWVKDGRLWMLDVAGGDTMPRQMGGTLEGVTISPLMFTRDSRHVVVGIRGVDLRDYRNPYPAALALVAIGKGDQPSRIERQREVELPTGCIFSSVLPDGADRAWQNDSTRVTVLCENMVTAQRELLQLDFATGRARTMWKGLATVSFVGWSRARNAHVISFEDLNTPGDYYATDSAFGRRTRLTSVEPRLAGVQFGPVETFGTTVPQYDGSLTSVTTAVLLPAGAKRGDRLPAIVVQYPGLRLSRGAAAEFGGGTQSSMLVSIFTSRGYAVVQVDAPIGPEDSPSEPASDMTDVILPQVQRAVDLGYANAQRIGILGHSAGGYSTAAIIAKTRTFRAAVAVAGFYDLVEMGNIPTNIRRRMAGPPAEDMDRYVRNSPFHLAGLIRTPLLLVHGEDDPACPVAGARKMFSALTSLGRPVELATYPGEGHVVFDWSQANEVAATDKILTFFNKYLAAK